MDQSSELRRELRGAQGLPWWESQWWGRDSRGLGCPRARGELQPLISWAGSSAPLFLSEKLIRAVRAAALCAEQAGNAGSPSGVTHFHALDKSVLLKNGITAFWLYLSFQYQFSKALTLSAVTSAHGFVLMCLCSVFHCLSVPAEESRGSCPCSLDAI